MQGVDLGGVDPAAFDLRDPLLVDLQALGEVSLCEREHLAELTQLVDAEPLIDAPADPKPLGVLPLLVGTRGPRMLRITARYAAEWNTWGDPATAALNRARLVEACERVERDPASFHMSVNALIALDGAGAAGASVIPGRLVLAGSVEQVRDALGRYGEAGFAEFIVPDWNLGESPAERADALARVSTELLPGL